ncbi:hypothetical protein DL764_006768 [Monosporascus ibericus]|uniref:Uncharacterized protein n=1 Tax=Monosporascus ibericus TaxID=155417 RepID=A0A4Q4T694_9PEZI|nr:hypothetical protein DL764_006768 [Monosporascus ibericus]
MIRIEHDPSMGKLAVSETVHGQLRLQGLLNYHLGFVNTIKPRYGKAERLAAPARLTSTHAAFFITTRGLGSGATWKIASTVAATLQRHVLGLVAGENENIFPSATVRLRRRGDV